MPRETRMAAPVSFIRWLCALVELNRGTLARHNVNDFVLGPDTVVFSWPAAHFFKPSMVHLHVIKISRLCQHLQGEFVLAHLVIIACRKRFINQLPRDRSAEAHLDETAFFGGVDGVSALDHVLPDGNVLGLG